MVCRYTDSFLREPIIMLVRRSTQDVLKRSRGLVEPVPDLKCSVEWDGRASSKVLSRTAMGLYEWNLADQDKCESSTDVVMQNGWNRTADVQNGTRLYNVTLTCSCSESAASNHPDGCYGLAQLVLYSWWTGPPWMNSLGRPNASERPKLWVDLEVAEVNCNRTVCSHTVLQQRPPYAQFICYNASLETKYGIVEAAETTPLEYNIGEVHCTATLYQYDALRSVLYGKGAIVSVNITGSAKQPGACVNYTSTTTAPFDERAVFTNWGHTLSLECFCAPSKSSSSSSCYRLAQNASAHFDFTPNIATVPRGSTNSRVLTIYPWDCTESFCLTSTDLYLEHRPKPDMPLLYAHALCYNQDSFFTSSSVPPPQVSLQCDVELTPQGSELHHTDRYPEIDLSNQTGRCIVRSDMAKANGRIAYNAGRRNRTAERTDNVTLATLKQYIRNVATEIYGVDLKFTCYCGYRSPSGESRGGESCYEVAKYVALSMWDGPLWRQKENVMLPTSIVNGNNTSTGRPISFSPSNCTDTNCSLSYALRTAPYSSALCMGVWPYRPKGLDLQEPAAANVTKCTLQLYEEIGTASDAHYPSASGKHETFEVTDMGSCVMTTNDTTTTSLQQPSHRCIPGSPNENIITAGDCGSWGAYGHLSCTCSFNSSNCYRAAKSVKWFYMLQGKKEAQCTNSNLSIIQFKPWHCTAGSCVTRAYVGATDNMTIITTDYNLASNNNSLIIYSQKLCNGNETADCSSPPNPEPPAAGSPPSRPSPPGSLNGIDNTKTRAIDVNGNVVIYSVGSTLGVSFIATMTALVAYSNYISSGLSRTASTTMPLISMLQNVQFIVIIGGAAGDSSSVYGKLAKELGWANFRFSVISSNSRGGTPSASHARSLLQSSKGGKSGPDGVAAASDGSLTDRVNTSKTGAYDQLLNASYFFAGIFALHWLILRLLRWRHHHLSAKSAKDGQDQGRPGHQERKLVLPPMLVFPCLEIQLLEITYGAACQAAGSLAAASYLSSGDAAPIAVSVVSFLYLGIVVAIMMSLVCSIQQLWKRPSRPSRSKGAGPAPPVKGGHRGMFLAYIPASKTSSSCSTWWGCHGGDDVSGEALPLADHGTGASSSSGGTGGCGGPLGPRQQQAQQPPPTKLRRLLDGLVKMCELPNEWKGSLDAGSWDDPGDDEEVLWNMQLQSERTERYLKAGMSLRAMMEPISIARCRYEIREPLNRPLPRTGGHRWWEGLLDAPGDDNQLNVGAAANSLSRSGGGDIMPAAARTASTSSAPKRKDDSRSPPPPSSAAADSSCPQPQLLQPDPSRASRTAASATTGGGSNVQDPRTSSHVDCNPWPMSSSNGIAERGQAPEGSIPFGNISRVTPRTETGKGAPKQDTQDEPSTALSPGAITIIASSGSQTGTGGLQHPSEGVGMASHDLPPNVSILCSSSRDPPAQDTEVLAQRRAWQRSNIKLMNTEGWTRMQLYERFGYVLKSYNGNSKPSVAYYAPKTFFALIINILLAVVDVLKAQAQDEVCRSGACVGFLSTALAVKTVANFYMLCVWPFINQCDAVMELITGVLQNVMLASTLAISRGSNDDINNWEAVFLGCSTASTILQGLALGVFVVIPAIPQIFSSISNPLKAIAACCSITFGVQSLDL